MEQVEAYPDHHKRMRRQWPLWLGLLPCSCILLGMTIILLQPPAFSSHSDIIRYMLEQRSIHPLQISAHTPWPDTVNYYAYGPQIYPYHLIVEVRLVDGNTVFGSVECHRDIYECQLTIIKLGLDRVAMPNIRSNRSNQLLEWCKEMFANMKITR